MWTIKRYLFPPMSKTVSRPTWSAEPKSAFTSSKLPHSAFLVRENHACNGFFAGGCFRQKSRKLFCEMTCMLFIGSMTLDAGVTLAKCKTRSNVGFGNSLNSLWMREDKAKRKGVVQRRRLG